MEIVAHIENAYKEKFGVPRQSGLAPHLKGRIVFEEKYSDPNAFDGLEGFDRIWIIWRFDVKEDDSDEPSAEEKAFLKRAIAKAAELGLTGHWERLPKRKPDHRGVNLPITYVFSTHRSLDELRKTPSPVAPYPDEVLIIMPFVQLPSAEDTQYVLSYDRYQPLCYRSSEWEYWNHSKTFLFHKREGGWSMDVKIMHGDDAVKQKTFSSIKPLLKAIYEPDEAK